MAYARLDGAQTPTAMPLDLLQELPNLLVPMLLYLDPEDRAQRVPAGRRASRPVCHLAKLARVLCAVSTFQNASKAHHAQ